MPHWLEDRVGPEAPAYQAFLRYEQGVSTDAKNPAVHTARALFEELKHDSGSPRTDASGHPAPEDAPSGEWSWSAQLPDGTALSRSFVLPPGKSPKVVVP